MIESLHTSEIKSQCDEKMSDFIFSKTRKVSTNKEDGPIELHECEVTRPMSEKGSRSWIGIEKGIRIETGRIEARGGDEIMNTGFLVIELLW
ncbi:hypothetical protein ACSBR2_019895 [Camellia fascicularis]